jgi:hypothetical protein
MRAVFTVEEQARRTRVTELRKELDSLNAQRPTFQVDADGDIVCPFCGASHFTYIEDIGNSRSVGEFLADERTLLIEGFYETDGCDDGDDGRLLCLGCGEDVGIPANVEVDFE